MKPFCSIHLSLRNLDLQHQKPQGWAEGLNTTPTPKRGQRGSEKAQILSSPEPTVQHRPQGAGWRLHEEI